MQQDGAQILQIKAEASVNDFMNSADNTHDTYLSTSIANLLNILQEKYKLDDAGRIQAISQFKQEARKIFSSDSRQNLELAFEYIDRTMNEKEDEMDYAVLQGELKLYPLKEVFPLVCQAIIDQKSYGKPPVKSTKEKELEARVLTLANCLIDLATSKSIICHYGVRNDLVMTLNGVYPGVNIVEDLNAYILAIAAEYFENDLQSLRKKSPKEHYKLLIAWMDQTPDEEEGRILKDYMVNHKKECKKNLVELFIRQGLIIKVKVDNEELLSPDKVDDEELLSSDKVDDEMLLSPDKVDGEELLLPDVAKKINETISNLLYIPASVGSDPLLNLVKQIFDRKFVSTAGGDMELELKSKREQVLQQARDSFRGHQGDFDDFKSQGDKLSFFVRLDDEFLKYIRIIDVVDKALPSMEESMKGMYAPILEKTISVFDELYASYFSGDISIQDYVSKASGKLDDLNKSSEQMPAVFRIKDWRSLESELSDISEDERWDFVISSFKDFPSCLRGIVTSGWQLEHLFKMMPEDESFNRRASEFAVAFLEKAPSEYLQKLIQNGFHLGYILSLLPEKRRLDFINNSLQPTSEYLRKVIQGGEQLWAVLDYFYDPGFIRLLLDGADPRYLQRIIQDGNTLILMLRLFPKEKRRDFIQNSLNATPEYFRWIFEGGDNIEEVKEVVVTIFEIFNFLPEEGWFDFEGNYLKFLPGYLQRVIKDVDSLFQILLIFPEEDRLSFLVNSMKTTPEYLQGIIKEGIDIHHILEWLPNEVREEFVFESLKITSEYLRSKISHGRQLHYVLWDLPKDSWPRLIKLWLNGASADYLQKTIHDASFLKDILNIFPKTERWDFIIGSFQATPESLRKIIWLGRDISILEMFPESERQDFVQLLLKEASLKYLRRFINDKGGELKSSDILKLVLESLPKKQHSDLEDVVGMYGQRKRVKIAAIDQETFLKTLLDGVSSDYLQTVFTDASMIKSVLEIIPNYHDSYDKLNHLLNELKNKEDEPQDSRLGI
ncbi:MAG: hypothetical protein KKE11_04205 [Gammaproteobacteria bacterium]|nr:hypothetical protein [Gammaproteobacteria bacterium]